MTECPSQLGRYIPWSFGESFACLRCGARVRQSHLVPPVSGSDYEAIYPIPAHKKAEP